jgi:DNA-binding HxlR family transcriptional regulator
MAKEGKNIFEQLFQSLNQIGVDSFEEFIDQFLARRSDKKRAIEELESFIAQFSNKALMLSLHLKQVHILGVNYRQEPNANGEEVTYTKSSLAKKYRVSVRTISNWINDGLECEMIGGVIRISQQAIKDFIIKAKSKKTNWKSISKTKDE